MEAVVGGRGFLQWRRRSGAVAVRAVDCCAQLGDRFGELVVLAEARFDPAQGVEHGGVVAAAVEAADLGQREVGQLAGEVDRDLAGAQRGGGAAGADQLGAGDAEALRRPVAGSPRPRSAWAERAWGMTSAISSELSGLAISEAWAITRVSAPCSWRTLASIRLASSESAPVSAISTPASLDEAAQDGEPGRQVGRLDRRRSAPTRSGRAGARRASRARSGSGRRRGPAGCRAS